MTKIKVPRPLFDSWFSQLRIIGRPNGQTRGNLQGSGTGSRVSGRAGEESDYCCGIQGHIGSGSTGAELKADRESMTQTITQLEKEGEKYD